MLTCDCSVCRSTNPRNHRYRSSVLISTPQGNILIDTSPELRLQLLREQIQQVHAVLYTHYHVDHLFGMDDLRLMARGLGGPIPIYCSNEVEGVIRQVFPYAFSETDAVLGSIPKLAFHNIEQDPFTVLGDQIVPIPLIHSRFNVLGFRINDLAYCTDVSEIPASSWPLLEGVRILIIDALRYKPHPAHLCLDQALEIIDRLQPENAYLTHMSHEFDYDLVNPSLPGGVEMAYDGLRIMF